VNDSGKDPYDGQLDVMEIILLGLDSVVIAGTGAGKTMPFMMPLLLNKSKKVIIISPTQDSASRSGTGHLDFDLV